MIKITSVLTIKLTWEQTTLLQVQTQKQTGLQMLKTKTKIHNEFSTMFTGIGYLKGTFLLKVTDAKPGTTKVCSTPLQEPFKKS